MSTLTTRQTLSWKVPFWAATVFSLCDVIELSLKGSVPWREGIAECIELSLLILLFGYLIREIVALDERTESE